MGIFYAHPFPFLMGKKIAHPAPATPFVNYEIFWRF